MNKDEIIKALRDTAQSASNTIAGNVAAPVDMIAWGLRQGGVPVPEDAVGSTPWMEQHGFVQPVDDGYAKLAGEAIGLTMPAVVGAKIAQPAMIEKFKGLQ